MMKYGRTPSAWSGVTRCALMGGVLMACLGVVTGFASGQGSDGVTTAKGVSLQDLLWSGGPVMWPLGLCSIVVLAFAVERFINLRAAKIAPASVMERVEKVIADGDAGDAIATLDQDPSPAARVFVAGLRHREGLPKEIEEAMGDVGRREVSRMRDNILPLNVVANIAPLLGLLGTVFGMIEAFKVVAAGTGLGKPEQLASGIYRALVTTAVGLSIAIPSLALYYYFNGRVIKLLRRIDELGTRLVERFRHERTEEAAA